MTYTKSNILQYNVYPPKPKRRREYYPFGLQTANSWTRENVTGNNFLYNGGTELNTTTNVYDLYFRNYDPALGRMNQVDPMAAKYASLTPYNYSFNNPVGYNDPSGAEPPQTINHSAFYNQYYIGYTYDDRIDMVSGTRQYVDNSDALKRWLGFFNARGGAGITGSGHWAVGLRGMAENLALLSGSSFAALYNTANLSDSERSNLALGLVKDYGGTITHAPTIKSIMETVSNNGAVVFVFGGVSGIKNIYLVGGITATDRSPGPVVASQGGFAAWMLAGQQQTQGGISAAQQRVDAALMVIENYRANGTKYSQSNRQFGCDVKYADCSSTLTTILKQAGQESIFKGTYTAAMRDDIAAKSTNNTY